MSKKNDIHPFLDQSPIEFLSTKNDSSLFVMGSHSKKRPHHLTLGRLFNGHVLDMVEMAIEQMKRVQDSGCGLGQKPLFVFNGEPFETSEEYKVIKNMILDFYRGETIDKVCLTGLDHVISVSADSALPGKLFFRTYKVLLKKSGTRVPRIELEEMGPSLDMNIDRVRLADSETLREATRQPKELKQRKVKNISRDEMGDKFGRVHMDKQDLTKLQTRKMKGLKRERKSEEGQEEQQEDN